MKYELLFDKVLSKGVPFSERTPVGKNGAMAFTCTPKTKEKMIWEIFGNEAIIPEKFRKAYLGVTSGPGFEKRRISQLNSSSLLALLCFWNVSKENPIRVDGVDYTTAYFEVQNIVFNNNSSIDVLLVSEDKMNWLFLESKFTEPLNPTNSYWVSEQYRSIYESLRDMLQLQLTTDSKPRKNNEPGFKISQCGKRYYGGIKQMISHTIGVLQGPHDNTPAPHREIYMAENKANIILGTVLYDFTQCGVTEFAAPYSDYVQLYRDSFDKDKADEIISCIVKAQKEQIKLEPSQLTIRSRPLTYQELFTGSNRTVLLPDVAEFYGL